MGKFSIGDKVKANDGLEGKVIFTDSARGKVAVKATNHGVGHNPGEERVYPETNVKKA